MVIINRITTPLELYKEKYWKYHKGVSTKLDKKVAIIEVVNAMCKPKSYIGSLICLHILINENIKKNVMPDIVCKNIEVFPRVSDKFFTNY